jgi:two-component system response regulator
VPSRCILHVEDEEAFALIAEIVLEDLREVIGMHHARSVNEAYRFLFKVGEYKMAPKPDLILLDLNLPPDNGYEVLEIIQGAIALKAIPVVVFSAANTLSDQRRSLSLGAFAHIGKPSSYDGYLKVLREVVKMIPQRGA